MDSFVPKVEIIKHSHPILTTSSQKINQKIEGMPIR